MTTQTLTKPVPSAATAPTQNATPRRISPFGPSDHAPTADFESDFRNRLVELAGPLRAVPDAPLRSTITVVATALRSGVVVDQVLGVVHGLSPVELMNAYQFVDDLRSRSEHALEALVAEPTVERFVGVEPLVALLMPEATARLARIARTDPESFGDAVADLDEQMRRFDVLVDGIEAQIEAGDPQWLTLLAALDDGRNQGVFHEHSFRPRRVGDLTPLRLASLLGETDRDDDRWER